MRKWTKIRYVDSYPPVPHWVARLLHWRNKPRCVRENRHVALRAAGSDMCGECGEILR
jgi:hypothetical protein